MGNKTTAMKHFIFGEQLLAKNQQKSVSRDGPCSVMVTLLTLKQEVQGRVQIPLPPHQSLEPKHPYTPPPGRKDVSRVPERNGVRESRAPGMTKKNQSVLQMPNKWKFVNQFVKNKVMISLEGSCRSTCCLPDDSWYNIIHTMWSAIWQVLLFPAFTH